MVFYAFTNAHIFVPIDFSSTFSADSSNQTGNQANEKISLAYSDFITENGHNWPKKKNGWQDPLHSHKFDWICEMLYYNWISMWILRYYDVDVYRFYFRVPHDRHALQFIHDCAPKMNDYH